MFNMKFLHFPVLLPFHPWPEDELFPWTAITKLFLTADEQKFARPQIEAGLCLRSAQL